MVYADLNMVRAGVENHPSEWPFCGYDETQNPPPRKSLIDHESLIGLFGVRSGDEFKEACRI
jgi:putative transposase